MKQSKELIRFGFYFFPVLLLILMCGIHPGKKSNSHKQDFQNVKNAEAQKHQALETFGKLPLRFEKNEGQSNSQVRFESKGRDYSIFFAKEEAVLALNKLSMNEDQPGRNDSKVDKNSFDPRVRNVSVLRMKFSGANNDPKMMGLEEQLGKSNYFIGNDSQKWQINVSNFSRVKYTDVYDGVDLVFYGNQQQLEYDFKVAPGIDPNIIKLDYQGADWIEIDKKGDLILHVAEEEIRQHKPFVYQEVKGIQKEISGSYVMFDENLVGFEIADYDTTSPLVIDPVLSFSTFIGGSGTDLAEDIAVDSSGNVYLTGRTSSINFPTEYPFLGANPGFHSAFVTKINPTGSALIYSTYIGGSIWDTSVRLALDGDGNVYITGHTESANFPTTTLAYDRTHGGKQDVFVVKLDSTGSSLLFSTFLGGSGADAGWGIVVDDSGNVYVGGETDWANFPTTPGAYDEVHNENRDVFLSVLNATGSTLLYSTFIGGSGKDEGKGGMTMDSDGYIYISGCTTSNNFPTTSGAYDTSYAGGTHWGDVFVSKINPAGSGSNDLLYSTYLGAASPGNNGDDFSYDIVVDNSGYIYVVGQTDNSGFPTTSGAYDTTHNGGIDAFVVKINPFISGIDGLLFSTFLGGSADDRGMDIILDRAGNVYAVGQTLSNNYPSTFGAYSISHNGSDDGFMTVLDPLGSTLLYSTFLGGAQNEQILSIALDSSSIYLAGWTNSSNFPTTPGAFDTTHNADSDVFVAKFTDIFPEVDTIPPTITAPADIILEATGPLTPVVLGIPTVFDDIDPNPSVTDNAPVPPEFSIGTTEVTWIATDASGNSASDIQQVIVQDTTPPVITIPADVNKEATGLNTPVTLITPTANDLVDLSPAVTSDAPAEFPLGTTIVTWTATDASGNFSSAAQQVIIIDTTPPTITIPDDITVPATSPAGTNVDYAAAALDLVDGQVPVAFSIPPGSLFPIGETTIECTATDNSSNIASDSFAVTVLSVIPTIPQQLTLDAMEKLMDLKTGDKKTDKEIDSAIKHLRKSLDPKLWIDETHLDPKHGHKVFDEGKDAVKELENLCKKSGEGCPYAEVINQILQSQEILVLTAISDAKNSPVIDPKNQDKVDKEIEKAEQELAKAYEELGKGKPDKAIDHLKKAWEHAQLASEHAQKTKGKK